MRYVEPSSKAGGPTWCPELDLGGSSNLTDSGIRHLHRATGLRTLNLSLCRYITDDGVADALSGAAFPSMTKVISP